jgi:hypothetical protein
MTNNKQQTAVDSLWEIAYNRDLTVADWKQAKEMEIAGKEMSYAEGYKEGYKRAMDYMTDTLKNKIEIKVNERNNNITSTIGLSTTTTTPKQ